MYIPRKVPLTRSMHIRFTEEQWKKIERKVKRLTPRGSKVEPSTVSRAVLVSWAEEADGAPA